ncbi:hypothetical protein [Methanobrevibacter sp. DSM 116169]|uniref:hypothetical protein n=1 Tax=Methanobrevibacter sp. DSM 116169 TaxID=3242727 RepID=UPI0038FC8844
MKVRDETETRDRKIARLKDEGYTLNEIYDMGFKNLSGNDLSHKYIQECIKKYSQVNYYGTITDSKLLTIRDLENIIKEPELKDKILKKRIKNYYSSINQKYLNKNPHNKRYEKGKVRASVLKRDNYECVKCGSFLGLECHHAVFKDDYVDIDEEINCCETLCYDCHRKIHD